MSRYPRFVEVMAEATPADFKRLSKSSGVSLDVIDALLAGSHAAGLAEQMRLGRALGINPLELFALDDDAEAALADRQRQGHPRYATDRAALRVVDR